ncbi:MAG: hypothetical protein HC819_05225 [Cyclobacteriaceae bacterium]|nr:hypothetical protein [Cyclobacteriaceae bacterium]
MLKKVAISFLVFSTAIVLGHSILPHNHQIDVYDHCSISNKEKLTLAQIIALTLTHNLGAQHLENFKSPVCQQNDASYAYANDVVPAIHQIIVDKHYSVISSFFRLTGAQPISRHYLPYPGMRAPPLA